MLWNSCLAFIIVMLYNSYKMLAWCFAVLMLNKKK